jgi:lipoate-protein ligase A
MTEQGAIHTYPPATWRLIVDGQADGATNMAVDEAILSAAINGLVPPTLRFYAWSPPCLSLGRNQPLTDVDQVACRAAGIDVVRRPTGGRAILHTDELTYSVVLPQSDPRAQGDVVQSYRQLSKGLLAGFRRLGAVTTQSQEHRAQTTEITAVCFETPSAYEITAGGQKLVGSAQWRARGGVLQHGTLPLGGDIARIVDVLAFSENEREEQRGTLRQRATTLEGTLGRTVPFLEAAQAMADGFSQALNLTLIPGSLTTHERELVAAYRGCYASSGQIQDT